MRKLFTTLLFVFWCLTATVASYGEPDSTHKIENKQNNGLKTEIPIENGLGFAVAAGIVFIAKLVFQHKTHNKEF